MASETIADGACARGDSPHGSGSSDGTAQPLHRASRCDARATDAISIQAAIAMTGRSQRTWWRRIEEGVVRKLAPDARGRARVSLEEVVKLIDVPLTSDDKGLLVRADAGHADAQDDIGEMFLSVGKHDAGRYWLELAAEQGHPNAMQCLARCYLAGEGVSKNENMAIRWLAEAAAYGHVIAREQMRGLRKGFLAR
jgi:TPR repeat protein